MECKLEEKENLIDKSKMLNIVSKIFFIDGNKKYFYNIFSMLDIMVNTSAIGSFPTSILEAMIFKVPIITLYNPGIMNIMRDEYNCLILKDNDASSIGDAVIRLLKDVELSNKLTVNALNTFEEKCSFEKTFDEISAISNL